MNDQKYVYYYVMVYDFLCVRKGMPRWQLSKFISDKIDGFTLNSW
jgi:hypothetical protein